MPASYVETTVADFDALLTAAKGWTHGISGREIVMEYRVKSNPRILIRVFTGLDVRSGAGRPRGGDAIRIVGILLHTDAPRCNTGRPLFKATRTHRTAQWRARVVERVTEAVNTCKARVARPGPSTGSSGQRWQGRPGPVPRDEADFHDHTF